MKIISFDKIKNLEIDPYQCYQWVTEAIYEKQNAILPAKISLKPDIKGVFYNTMPVLFPPLECGGVKVVTRYPERKPSLDSEILLYDLKTGKNIALLDGNWITAMRTGAVAVHSIVLFAKQGFKTVGFIGVGNTARATLKVLEALYPSRNFTIKVKKYKEQHEVFAYDFEQYSNIEFEFCDTNEELVENSDVVISAATVMEQDVCSDEHYQDGILVIPIHTRGFTNCDLFFDKVFVDDMSHVKGFRYFDRFKSVAEVADVMRKNKAGRENDKEKILAYNIGIALHDIYFAKKIYDMISEECEDISFYTPQSKFWV